MKGNYSGVRAFNDPHGELVMTRIGRRLAPGAAPVPIYAPIYAYVTSTPVSRWKATAGELKEVKPDGGAMP